MSRLGRPAKLSRDGLLAAAERVVAAHGANGLSFEAVAREAGVSKGGVLHHFGTREALVAAMVERLILRLSPVPAQGDDPAGPTEVMSAILESRRADGGQDLAAGALLAAVTQNLSVLAPLKAANGGRVDRFAAVLGDRYQACLLHFCLDGLWLSEVLGISPLTGGERSAFFDNLVRSHEDEAKSENP